MTGADKWLIESLLDWADLIEKDFIFPDAASTIRMAAEEIKKAAGREKELVAVLEGMVELYNTDEGCQSAPEVIEANRILKGIKK